MESSFFFIRIQQKLPEEQKSRQKQGCAQPAVEYGDKDLWHQMEGPQGNTHDDHKGHDAEGTPVEKFPEAEPFFGRGKDTGRMLFHQTAEHTCLENGEYRRRQGQPQRRHQRSVGQHPQTQDIKAGNAPDNTRQKEEGPLFYHKASPAFGS